MFSNCQLWKPITKKEDPGVSTIIIATKMAVSGVNRRQWFLPFCITTCIFSGRRLYYRYIVARYKYCIIITIAIAHTGWVPINVIITVSNLFWKEMVMDARSTLLTRTESIQVILAIGLIYCWLDYISTWEEALTSTHRHLTRMQ